MRPARVDDAASPLIADRAQADSGSLKDIGGRPSWRRIDALRLITFDLDGVLVDSIEVTRRAFELAYREIVGAEAVPFDEYRTHLGRHFRDIMRLMKLPLAMEEPFVRESYRLAAQVQVFDGVRGLLEELTSRGIGLGVATGKGGERARSLLAELELLHFFGLVVGGDEVRRAKPAPDMVLANLRHFHVEPDQALLIGDSVLDLRAGRNASVWVAAALWGDGSEDELRNEQPDLLVQDPRHLLDLLLEGGP